MRGQVPQPFKFKIIGLLATIGRCHGGAEIFGWQFSGYRVVAVAHDLLEQTSRLAKKGSGRARLDSGSDFLEGPRSIAAITVFGDVGDGSLFNCNDA